MSDGSFVRTLSGRWAPRQDDVVLALPGGRGRASEKVQVAAASVMFAIDDVFPLSEVHANLAVLANLRVSELSRVELEDPLTLLYRTGYVGRFFQLCRPRNDSDGRLRRYLLDREVGWDRVLMHYEFEFWDAGEFVAGFMLGVGQSFLEVFEFLHAVFGFFLDKSVTVRQLLERLQGMSAGLWDLDIPAMLGAAWRQLNAKFSEHLLQLDFMRAGMVLGKLGADLFGILSGAAALAKALGTLTRKAVGQLLPLFRNGMKTTVTVAQIVARIGPSALAKARRIGLATLGLVTRLDEFAKWFASGAVAFVDDLMSVFVRVDDPVLIGLGPGQQAVLWSRPNSSSWMTVVFNAMTPNNVDRLIDDVIKQIDRLGRGPKGTRGNIERVTKQGEVRDIARRLEETNLAINQLRDVEALAQQVRNDLVAELSAAGSSLTDIDPKWFGRTFHERMEKILEARVPALKQVGAHAFAEWTMADLALDLHGQTDLLNAKLLDVIKAQPDLMKQLPTGVRRVETMLERMKYTNDTRIGNLKNDLVVMRGADHGADALVIDYSSDRKLELLGERILEERARHGGKLPQALNENLLAYYGGHAMFTIYIRHWILERIFPTFNWYKSEVLYKNIVTRKP